MERKMPLNQAIWFACILFEEGRFLKLRKKFRVIYLFFVSKAKVARRYDAAMWYVIISFDAIQNIHFLYVIETILVIF
jgi:hypothetical protein